MLLPLLSIDPSASRANAMTMPDQALMELLIESCVSRKKTKVFQNAALKHSGPTPACRWDGVQCDSQENIIRIEWAEKRWLLGPISLDMLPQRLQRLDLRAVRGMPQVRHQPASVHGTVNTAALPGALLRFNINNNKFYGSLDLTTLPEVMEHFGASNNSFEGNVDLTGLPPGLTYLNLGWNRFSGGISLEKLPRGMESLQLQQNAFWGWLVVDALPGKPFRLHVTRSNFSSIVGEASGRVIFH